MTNAHNSTNGSFYLLCVIVIILFGHKIISSYLGYGIKFTSLKASVYPLHKLYMESSIWKLLIVCVRIFSYKSSDNSTHIKFLLLYFIRNIILHAKPNISAHGKCFEASLSNSAQHERILSAPSRSLHGVSKRRNV